MKKLLICLLSLLLLLSVSGCGSKKDGTAGKVESTTEEGLLDLMETPDTTSVAAAADILSEAAGGKMQGIDITLGTGVMAAYSALGNPEHENFATTTPSVEYDGFTLYYQDSGSKPITSIVDFQNYYSFMVGASDKKDVSSVMGTAEEDKTLDGSELYFMADKSTPADVLGYHTGDNMLRFYFVNDYLVAIVLQAA